MTKNPKKTTAAVQQGVRSKDQGQLSVQIDTGADNLPKMMVKTRDQKNNAIAQGDLDQADQLDNLSAIFAGQYAVLVRHELKNIDDSDLMQNTIKGFASVNQQINDAITSIKKLTEFTKAATKIAGALDQLIGVALKAG